MRDVLVILRLILHLTVPQASHTGEDICCTVLQDVAKAALCECDVIDSIYSPECSRLSTNMHTNMQLHTSTQLSV